jgi:hypothetical protein
MELEEVILTSKFQSYTVKAPSKEFEGAITSGMNIRPDEVILKNFGSNPTLNITLINGKKIELPLHTGIEKNRATLVIPEKFYKEAETDPELSTLLEGLFENQRNLEVEIENQGDKIILQPIGEKRGKFKIFFS